MLDSNPSDSQGTQIQSLRRVLIHTIILQNFANSSRQKTVEYVSKWILRVFDEGGGDGTDLGQYKFINMGRLTRDSGFSYWNQLD